MLNIFQSIAHNPLVSLSLLAAPLVVFSWILILFDLRGRRLNRELHVTRLGARGLYHYRRLQNGQ